MITAGDFKKGITIEWDGGVWNIVDFQHVKPGKGAAFVRTKIKNIMTGAVVERSFNPTDQVEDAIPYVKEGTNVTVKFFKGSAFSVAAPNFVEMEVIDTEPGFKGDTASNTYKPAKVETGYSVQVPLFINIGDHIRIDTRTGEYMERC